MPPSEIPAQNTLNEYSSLEQMESKEVPVYATLTNKDPKKRTRENSITGTDTTQKRKSTLKKKRTLDKNSKKLENNSNSRKQSSSSKKKDSSLDRKDSSHEHDSKPRKQSLSSTKKESTLDKNIFKKRKQSLTNDSKPEKKDTTLGEKDMTLNEYIKANSELQNELPVNDSPVLETNVATDESKLGVEENKVRIGLGLSPLAKKEFDELSDLVGY